MTPDLRTVRPGPSRRTLLRVVAASGGAVVLAACGGDDETSGTGNAGGTDNPGNETPTGAGSPAENGGSAGGGLVATADVPVGSGVILEQEKVVVTQLTEGQFQAFTAVCTHQSCTVASINKERISCPCHGSAYSVQDGSVLNGPATRPLKEIPVAVEGDQVVRA